MFRPWHIFIFGALTILFPLSPSTAAEVESVWVESTQTGPRSLSSHLLILRNGNTYFADFHPYSRAQIQRLVDAIAASPIPQLDLKALKINQQWLDANAEQALKNLKKSLAESKWPQPEEKKIILNDADFLDIFKNLNKVRELLENYYPGKWQGDIVEVKVIISFQDGGKAIAHSRSRHVFMIPWTVKRNGESHRTFNPLITAALVDLLPNIFLTNRDLLSEDLAHFIARRLIAPPAGKN